MSKELLPIGEEVVVYHPWENQSHYGKIVGHQLVPLARVQYYNYLLELETGSKEFAPFPFVYGKGNLTHDEISVSSLTSGRGLFIKPEDPEAAVEQIRAKLQALIQPKG